MPSISRVCDLLMYIEFAKIGDKVSCLMCFEWKTEMKNLPMLLSVVQCFWLTSESHAGSLIKELPQKPYQQSIKFPPVNQEAKSINISGTVKIPMQQQPNLAAPNFVKVYQFSPKGWEEIGKYGFKPYADHGSMEFSQELKLGQSDQKFALHITVSHCHKNGRGLCVIDHFQGVVDRSLNAKLKLVNFKLDASDPATFNK